MSEKDFPVKEEDSRHPEIQEVVNPSGISHAFDTGYAIAYGVDEAIMIRNLQFFITINANRGHNFKEGRFWTYDRLNDFLNHFPYWTIQTVRRVIASLISQGVIIKGEFNSEWSNRTQWYAFKDQEKFIKNIKPPKTPSPLPPSDLPEQEKEESKEKITDLLKSTTDKCSNQQVADVEINNCNIGTPMSSAISSSSSSLKVPASDQAKHPANAVVSDETEVDSIDSHEKSQDEKPKRKRTPSEFSQKVRETADQMLNSLVRTKPNYVPPRNMTAFLTHLDFIIRLDGRDPSLIMDVFNWALADSFWSDKLFKPNPAEYLRKQFDQLEMKMNAKPPLKDRKFAPSSEMNFKNTAKGKAWAENVIE